MTTTMSLPAFSGRRASSRAAHTAAPEEMPTSKSLFGGYAAGDGKGIVVLDADHLVVDRRVEHGGNETGADPLDQVRPLGAAGKHRRSIGFDGDDLDSGFGPEALRQRRSRSRRCRRRKRNIDLAVGIAHLLGRRGPVHRRIGRIFELLGNEVAGIGGGQILGLLDRPAHAPRTGREDQFGAVGLGSRRRSRLMVSGMTKAHLMPRAAQTMARPMPVLPRSAQDDRVGPDEAGGLGGVEHRHGDTVLDAVAGVEELQFSDDGSAAASADAVEADRGIADELGDIRAIFMGDSR